MGLPFYIYCLFILKSLIFKHALYWRHFCLDISNLVYNCNKLWWNSEAIWNNNATILRDIYAKRRYNARGKANKGWHTWTDDCKPYLQPFINTKGIPLHLHIIITHIPKFLNKFIAHAICPYCSKLIKCFLADIKYIGPCSSFYTFDSRCYLSKFWEYYAIYY